MLRIIISCVIVLAACIEPPDEPELASATQAICLPGDPCPPPPLVAPDFSFVSRTATSLAMQFPSLASYSSTAIERRVPGGSWTTATTFPGGAATRSYTNTGLANDSVHCYRVRVTAGGETARGFEQCAATRMPGSHSLGRVQLRVVVADVGSAGTDNRVGVRLSWLALPGYNFTGMNYAPVLTPALPPLPPVIWVDDFKRDKDFTYDLELGATTVTTAGVLDGSLATLHDIGMIEISKYGSDGLCIERVELIVDGAVAFSKLFGTTSATCHWLDNSGGHSEILTIPRSELRAASSFTSFQPADVPVVQCPTNPSRVCVTVPRIDLERRIEGTTGHTIWSDPRIYWSGDHIFGGRAVEVSRSDSNTLAVDLDLTGTAPIVPDPEVDMNFFIDLSFAPSSTGTGFDLRFDVRDFDANVNFGAFVDILGFLFCPEAVVQTDCVDAIEDWIGRRIQRDFTAESSSIPINNSELCASTPTVVVNSDASLTLSCTPDVP